ncbi:SxtJ family membrane protein [Spirosoma montaniterrae]|uniref:SxtJ n=1 Tax=Spirosoma montaniterrae TaxID=1178516 RepID=A0A1P9WS51_9BACT|nr:SxtJ family membrane protein [Spirosoma montaniterrae]AQG78197.1 hypothetical protein AWR27_01845 [Spirosoma montaniterrae]
MLPKELSELNVWKANTAIMVGLLALHIFTESHYPIWLYAAFGIGMCILFLPHVSRWIAIGWYKLARGLGYVNSKLLLSLLFFVFLLPLALLYRLLRRNALALTNGPQLPTLYKERNHRYRAEDLENTW